MGVDNADDGTGAATPGAVSPLTKYDSPIHRPTYPLLSSPDIESNLCSVVGGEMEISSSSWCLSVRTSKEAKKERKRAYLGWSLVDRNCFRASSRSELEEVCTRYLPVLFIILGVIARQPCSDQTMVKRKSGGGRDHTKRNQPYFRLCTRAKATWISEGAVLRVLQARKLTSLSRMVSAHSRKVSFGCGMLNRNGAAYWNSILEHCFASSLLQSHQLNFGEKAVCFVPKTDLLA